MRRTRLLSALAQHNRRRKARIIDAYMRRTGARTVIFVGASAGSRPQDGIVEAELARTSDVRSVCNVVPTGLPWPSVIGDGRRLPYADDCVDLVVSNAVIEHVGDAEDQSSFVQEHHRVGRAFALTTPNRWHPVEPHTAVLLRHWSRAWRAKHQPHEFTRLLSRAELRALLPAGSRIVGRWYSPTFIAFGPPRDVCQPVERPGARISSRPSPDLPAASLDVSAPSTS